MNSLLIVAAALVALALIRAYIMLQMFVLAAVVSVVVMAFCISQRSS